MERKLVLTSIIVILFTSLLVVAFRIEKAQASGTIYIRADGSVEGTDKIFTMNNITYTFTDNIYDSIVVERDNIVIDGAEYTLQGTGSGTGVYLSDRENVTLRNAQITNFNYGIWLHYSSNNSVSESTITNNEIGIRLYESYNNSVSGNNITANNYRCIWLYFSYNNSVSGNNITANNGWDGIYLGSSSNNSVSGNNITANSYYGILLSSFSNYNSISGNNIANNDVGIWLSYSSNYNSISGNNITNNDYGIRLYSSSNNNTISGNNIIYSHYGVYLDWSSDNIVSGNNITNSDYGVYCSVGENNTIYGNEITNNSYGVYLLGCWDVIVSENNITNNYSYGVYLNDASGNKFYYNNFINTQQVYDTPEEVNVWDAGYPSGGNYWSDYTGVDEKSGPNQNETGSDGIGDTPYVIDADNQDNYPLTKPYGGPHDIGTTDVTPSKTVVGQGYCLHINMTIINYGIYDENFNVTAYANTTIISQTEVTLTSRNSTTVIFTWNTTGFVKGNYSISANVTILPGETDTADNTYVDGWVFVTIPGDVDGDRDVDIFDIVAMIGSYGSEIGDPEYESNYDIDDDGDIDIFDIVIACNHYGESW